MMNLISLTSKFNLASCLVFGISLLACDHSQQPRVQGNIDKKNLFVNTNRSQTEQQTLPKLVAASRVTSYLVKGLLQQARGGRDLGFKIRYNVDHALSALQDQKVIAAFYLERVQSLKTPQNSPIHHKLKTIKVAKTNLWWASKQTIPELSQKQWRALVSQEEPKLPNGKDFQLCLRAEPDNLEKLWSDLNPEDKELLSQARQSGHWPVFNDETSLIEHLHQRPEAIALFTEGNLKLKGTPFTRVRFSKTKSTEVQAQLSMFPVTKSKLSHHVFNTLLNTLNSAERQNAVQEWGWNP